MAHLSKHRGPRAVGLVGLILWFALALPIAFMIIHWTKTSRAIEDQTARYEEGLKRLSLIQAEIDGVALSTAATVPPLIAISTTTLRSTVQ